jgi:hypothetical protein
LKNILFLFYLLNTLVLIIHEIDSAYWKEWELFHLAGGESAFLLLHIPLLLPVLYGLVSFDRGETAGLILSLIVSGAGVSTFAIHTFFTRRGYPQFKTPVSRGILWGTLLLSLGQCGLTVAMLVEITGGF